MVGSTAKNVTSKVETPDKVEAVAETVKVTKTTAPAPKVTPFTQGELMPSNWNILPEDDGIVATNSVTGRTFKGTVAEFSAMLK